MVGQCVCWRYLGVLPISDKSKLLLLIIRTFFFVVKSAHFFQKMQNVKENDSKLRQIACYHLLFLDLPIFVLTELAYPQWWMAKLSPFGVAMIVVTSVTFVLADRQAKTIYCGYEEVLTFRSKIEMPFDMDFLPCM